MTDQAWRVGIWCAVSSKPQAAEDKSSLQDQERAGRRFAATVGEAVAVYRVPGHSRTMWRWEEAERQMPAYRKLREDAEAQRIDVLWCLESSRLGRDAALVQQVVSLLESSGAELYRADTPHQLGQKSTGHRFLDAFGSVIAQQEADLKRHRHRSGMRGRVRRGLFATNPPYGYAKAGDGYEQTDAAGAIRMITELYIAGYNISEIGRRMDDSGFPPKKSQFWNQRSIYDIVANNAYAGFPRWGDAVYDGEGPSPHYEPIWDAAMFAAVVQERERRKEAGYVRRGAGPLSGVARCARCGYAMGRVFNGTNFHYLRCTTHAHRNIDPYQRTCHKNWVREDRALTVLGDYIRALGTDDTLDRIMARRQEQRQGDESAEELDRLRHQLADLDGRRERLALAYAAGDMALAYYRKADDALASRQDAAQRRAAELERYLASLPDLDTKREQLSWFFQNVDALLEQAEPAEISKALQQAGFVLYCEDSTCWVDWH